MDVVEIEDTLSLPRRSLGGDEVIVSTQARVSLSENLIQPSTPYLIKSNNAWITTSIFDMYKIGPGPSSSHTIGPMKAGFDTLQTLRHVFEESSQINRQHLYKLEIHLHGSLSATGKGHGTDTAVVGGLLGWRPHTCDPEELRRLLLDKEELYALPIVHDRARVGSNFTVDTDAGTATETPKTKQTARPNSSPRLIASPPTAATTTDGDGLYFPFEELSVNSHSFVWHPPAEGAQFPHPNTLLLRLVDHENPHSCVIECEYYSVGGGFITKKDCPDEDTRSTVPVYPYHSWETLKRHLERNPNLDLAKLMLANEMALTGLTETQVYEKTEAFVRVMHSAVLRGLNTEGVLPGSIRLQRKAPTVYRKAQGKTDYLPYLNAYSMAASEENAAGNVVVTAPTSGASGVIPGLLYFMTHHLFIDSRRILDAILAGTAIGFIVKRNSSISGAEMGCMGEIGTAAAMGAAMLAYATGCTYDEIEAAAEIAMEHHLGVTCDPIGGYVQVPCIQRNPMGAVKAYNAYILATASAGMQVISFDKVVQAMKETGEDMNQKYRETSTGGLALTLNCTEC